MQFSLTNAKSRESFGNTRTHVGALLMEEQDLRRFFSSYML
jgi:hypothetical protein